MLQALIHGKIDRWLLKNPWEIEDLLTAVVFGSCENIGIDGWTAALHPFLAQAVDLNARRASRMLGDILPPARDVSQVSYNFWPNFGGFQRDIDNPTSATSDSIAISGASPEVIICLTTTDQRKWFVLIEVKLNIGKSAGPSASPHMIGDQLAKYWEHLKRYAMQEGGTALAAVYVTPWSRPYDEIEETRKELEKCGERDAPIFWVSWRDFVSAVCQGAEEESKNLPSVVWDVCRLLRDRWGFIRTEIAPWPPVPPVLGFSLVSMCFEWKFAEGVANVHGHGREFVFSFERSPICRDSLPNVMGGSVWKFASGEGRLPR